MPGDQQEGKKQGGATLFQKLGGVKVVKVVVETFYGRILSDENIAHFFDGVNMAHLKRHQVEFMKVAFTQVPKELDLPQMMVDKHMRLFRRGLRLSHFDAVVDHFVDALEEHKIDKVLIRQAEDTIASLRDVFDKATQDYGMGVSVSI